jgi:predicted nucleic acid-binding protein
LALYYLDTSALVKLYVREPGTPVMLELAGEESGNGLVLLSLTPVEFRSALRRRQREGDVDGEQALELLGSFAAHLDSRFIRHVLTDGVIEIALGLIDRYALRAYDALQLAGCVAMSASSPEGGPVFVCADDELCKAARNEDLPTLNPAGGRGRGRT